MTAYKFHLGQEVEVLPLHPERWPATGQYVVTERFRRGGENHYGVKGSAEPYERIVTESQLRAVASIEENAAAPHHIPRFLLARWANDGRLVSYQWSNRTAEVTENPRTSLQTAISLPDVSQFHVSVSSGHLPYQKFLASHVDAPAANALDAMLRNGVSGLTADQRGAWARLLVSLGARTPEALRLLQAVDRRTAGVSECGEEIVELPVKVTVNELKVSAVLDMQWWLRRFEGKTMLFSDRPLLTRPRTAQLCGMPLEDASSLIILPVSPNTVFFATADPTVRDKTRKMPKGKLANMINEEAVWRAARHVYAPNSSMGTFIHERMVGKRNKTWHPK